MARQPMGQHFLVSESWRARVCAALEPPADFPWIEIGPGHGEITRALARHGARVIAIETDELLARQLRARAIPGVEVVHGDILQQDLAVLAGGPFRVYGSLPYYITSPILHHVLGRFATLIRDIHVILQLEVAERIISGPGTRDFGYLSVFCQVYAHSQILFPIPSRAFQPPPRVESALVRLVPPGELPDAVLPQKLFPGFLEFVKVCFHQKRKMLRNNLRGSASTATIGAALESTGIQNSARAEEIEISALAALYKLLLSEISRKQEGKGLTDQPF